MNFFSDLGDRLQTGAENVFSNYTEKVQSDVYASVAPFISFGDAPKSNLTAEQVMTGQKGENPNVAPIVNRGVKDAEQLKGGLGFNIQDKLLKLGPIGVIGIAVVAALLLRKKR